MPDEGGNELLNEEGEQDSADEGEVEVVDDEEGVELEGLAVAHDLAADEDDDVVRDEGGGGLGQAGHWGLAGDEIEAGGLVAAQGLEGPGEDGP